MSQAELDALFGACRAGPIPDGEAKSTPIIAPGSFYSEDIAEAVNNLAWKGRTFDAKAGFLRSEVGLSGMKAIIARLYRSPSWLDGKECIVLDYSETSTVAGQVRNEIRLVCSGLYLGKVYKDSRPLLDFCLDFRKTRAVE